MEHLTNWICINLLKMSSTEDYEQSKQIMHLCVQNGMELNTNLLLHTIVATHAFSGNLEKVQQILNQMANNGEKLRTVAANLILLAMVNEQRAESSDKLGLIRDLYQ